MSMADLFSTEVLSAAALVAGLLMYLGVSRSGRNKTPETPPEETTGHMQEQITYKWVENDQPPMETVCSVPEVVSGDTVFIKDNEVVNNDNSAFTPVIIPPKPKRKYKRKPKASVAKSITKKTTKR